MITIFNRKELLTTFSMDEQNRVRDLLAQSGIDYRVKAVCPTARASAFGDSGRARTGSFGIGSQSAYQYYIYVHRKDHARAQALL